MTGSKLRLYQAASKKGRAPAFSPCAAPLVQQTPLLLVRLQGLPALLDRLVGQFERLIAVTAEIFGALLQRRLGHVQMLQGRADLRVMFPVAGFPGRSCRP